MVRLQMPGIMMRLFLPLLIWLTGTPEPVIGQKAGTVPPGKIVFMSNQEANWEIYSMDTKGENVTNLTFTKVMDYWASPSPDGKKIYFYSDRKGNNDITVMDVNGKNQTTVERHPASDRMPNVSPDGKRIVFVSDRDHALGEIYTMNTDGSNLKRLTQNSVAEDVAFWSPDGAGIIFSKDASITRDTAVAAEGDFQIFFMKADGTGETKLTSQPGFCSGAVFSPDGKRIAFYGRSEEGHSDIFTMKPNGKGIKNITRDAAEDYSPSWSPDGKWIAFTSGAFPNYDIWIMHLSSGERRKLTSHPKRDESPVWLK